MSNAPSDSRPNGHAPRANRRGFWPVVRGVLAHVVAPVVFTLGCLWFVGYFLLNASWARDYVREQLPRGVEIAAHRYGPNPFHLRLGGVRVVVDDVSVVGGSAVVDATVFPIGLDGLDAAVDELVIRADKPPGPKGDKEDKPTTFTLADLDDSAWPVVSRLHGGVRRLWVDLPGTQLWFGDVVADRGPDGGVVVTATACELRSASPRLVWGGNHCQVELSGSLQTGGLEARVTLLDTTGSRVEVRGGLIPDPNAPDKGRLALSVDLALSAAVADVWTDGRIQGAIALRGLRAKDLPLDEAPEKATLAWDALSVDDFLGGGAALTGIATGPGRIDVWPAGLLTRVELAIEDLGVHAAAMADLSVGDVRLGRFHLSFDKRAEGLAESFTAASWETSTGKTTDIHADALFGLGVAGGTFRGLATTSDGVLGGELAVKRNPFNGKLSVGARFDADAVVGRLRAAIAGDCADVDPEAALALRGVDLALSVDDGEIALERDAATVVTTAGTQMWDGFDWAAPEADPESP